MGCSLGARSLRCAQPSVSVSGWHQCQSKSTVAISYLKRRQVKSLSFGHLDCCARWGNVSLLLPASGSTAETLFTTDIFRTEKLKARGKLEQHGLHVLLVYFYVFFLQHFNHRLEQQIQWCPARHRIWQRGNRSAWRKESGDREKAGFRWIGKAEMTK